jgi:hypothetical protein
LEAFNKMDPIIIVLCICLCAAGLFICYHIYVVINEKMKSKKVNAMRSDEK